MHACHFSESAIVVLSAAAAAGHVGVTQAVKELLRFLSLTQSGLLYLLAQAAPTNLMLRLLASVAESEGEENALTAAEGALTGPGFGEEGFCVWLMQALHALQGVSELMGHVAAGGEGGAGLEEGDNPEVLGMLHALYLMTFTLTGRSAVAHVLSLENNLSCLVTLLQHHSKDGQGYGCLCFRDAPIISRQRNPPFFLQLDSDQLIKYTKNKWINLFFKSFKN